MAPPFSPRTSSYPTVTFDLSRLSSLESVEQLTYEFQAMARKDNLASILEDLLEETNSNALPLALCCLDQLQQSWILDLFPNTVDAFPDSLSQRLVSKLSRFFLAATPFLSHCSPPASRDKEIEAVKNILVELAALEFTNESTTNSKPSQREIKKQRRANARSRAVNPQPFKALDVSIPTSAQEVEELKNFILTQQKSVLQSYLEAICSDNLALAVKQNCIVTLSEPALEPVADPEAENELEVIECPTMDPQQSVYPKVQPLKSALHFDSPDGFGELIVISETAEKELRFRHKKERKTFDIIVKKIKELSHGHLSPDNHKRLNRSGSEAVVFEAKMTSDLRLVYQVDLVPHFDGRMRQAFKIFGIFTHAKMDDRMWDGVGKGLASKSKKHREQCAVRRPTPNADDHTFSPAFFPPLAEISELTDITNMLVDESNLVYSRFLMAKYVALSQPLMNCRQSELVSGRATTDWSSNSAMLADLDVTYPHVISAQEKRIVEHPNSCYVVGRSGTGKTTTLLFKMLLVEHTYRLADPLTPKPRQVFVTQSRILAHKVKGYYATLARALQIATQSPSQLLELKDTVSPELDDANIAVDDIQDWDRELPTKFSELEEKHFPLFVTYSALCGMIEADMADNKAIGQVRELSSSTSYTKTARRWNLVIDFDRFKKKYWPRLPEPLTKKTDPALAFSELIGIIKGSEATLGHDPHLLPQAAYQAISRRKYAMTTLDRGEMYALLEAYMKKKKEEGGKDIADRSHVILDYFSQFGVPGQKVDQLYVDEVQDNLLIDTLVLRAICLNPDGLFWAGDTAQAISAGSSFRFNDLRAFQWRLEKRLAQNITTPSSSPPSSTLAAKKAEIFQLAVNYRSHAGIVNCAHSVIDLIIRFWPGTIDNLAPEIGNVDGPKPIFFDGKGDNTSILNEYLFGDSGNRIEFGAHQCILVRDEDARCRLRQELGHDIGVVLTIYESKGLEFNDVLIYNFFEDSNAEFARWRVILNAIDKFPASLPKLDNNKHATIWLELKFLYVAMTRARENVWIADVSNKGEPLREYWNSRGLIRNMTPGVDAPKLATSSSTEEWFERGKQLFRDYKKYQAAKHCFERAREPDYVFMTDSYILHDRAEGLVDRRHRKPAFRDAAEAFRKCSEIFPARRLEYLTKSADCFYQAEELLVAAEIYVEIKQFDIAAECYRDLSMFDEAVKIVKQERERLDTGLVNDIIRKAKFFYFSSADSLPASDPKRQLHIGQGVDLFEDKDPLEYLEDRFLDGARGDVLVTLHRFKEAAELQWSEGNVFEAIELFLQDQTDSSSRRAGECILEALWQELPFGHRNRVVDQNSSISRLLHLSSMLSAEVLGGQEHQELLMFRVLSSQDPNRHTFREMGQVFLAAQNLPAGLLCLDHYFDSSPILRDYEITLDQLAEELEVLLHFVELLASQVRKEPTEDPELAKFFGVRRSNGNVHRLSPQSPLCHYAQRHGADRVEGATSASELHSLIRNIVFTRLASLIKQTNEHCKNIKAFSLCLPYSRVGRCNRVYCSKVHILASDIDSNYYTLRVRIHLQQVLLLTRMRYLTREWHDQRRYWLKRLYEALHPPHHTMGGMANLTVDQLPETRKDHVGRIRYWIEEFFYSHKFLFSQSFLSLLIRGAILALDAAPSLSSLVNSDTLVHDTEASRYLYRGLWSMETPPPEFIRSGGSNVVHDLLASLEGSAAQSLTKGILAVRHIIQKQIPIEISLLCDILDSLCKNLILSRFCYYNGSNIHRMSLPRSWLMTPIDIERCGRRNFGFLNVLIEPVVDLLAQIYTGEDASYLLYESSHLAYPISGVIRSVFITRVCRALALIGYNYRSDDLKDTLLSVYASLRRFSPPPPPNVPYSWYVYSNAWGGIINTVRRSARGSPMDEMVELFHRDRLQPDEPLWDIPFVRRLVYDELENVPKLLRQLQSETYSERTVVDEPQEQTVNEQVEDRAEAQNEPDDDVLNAPAVSESVEEELEANIPSEEELQVLSKLPTIYKKNQFKRRGNCRTAMAQRRNDFFLSCLKESERIPSLKISMIYITWKFPPTAKYRKLMLGPLPHLLSCLEVIYHQLLELKSATKTRLQNAGNHVQLSELETRRTSITSAIKKVTFLQRTLSPTSRLHSECSENKLEQYVCDMKELISNGLPVDLILTTEMKYEFELGWNGTARPHLIYPAKKRSELNTSDV
ncbi:hypothetical protein E1B28_001736 [Marasmius oreades]|uniref:UvrD-like helicase ATP-binding domain-containing protein n=1 Tax=Marasmius oreades TaxID=181124 RepID=A0A9P8AFV2_9AGAR|nr:uncharacterized protein E1B28_001736 [Marasmius oreades]KAG7099943.1 hypothetical protein E1B28_001736 [Marasmius oreades]